MEKYEFKEFKLFAKLEKIEKLEADVFWFPEELQILQRDQQRDCCEFLCEEFPSGHCCNMTYACKGCEQKGYIVGGRKPLTVIEAHGYELLKP